jgi:AraC-like DNA-binding protein
MEITAIDIELKQIRKQFMDRFVGSIMGLLIFYSVFYYYLDLKIVAYIEFTSFCATGYIYFYIISKFEYNFEAATDIAFPSFTFLAYIKLLILWQILPISYIWFFTIPIAVLMIKSFKATLYWTLIVLTLAASAPLVSDFLNIRSTVALSPKSVMFVNYSIISLSIYLLIFLLYYMNEFNKLGLKQSSQINPPLKEPVPNLWKEGQGNTSNHIEDIIKKEKPSQNNKFEGLYEEIARYFEEKQPYQHPDFNIQQLALDLNSNVTYISKALNQKNGANFKSFLNNYRIKEVKRNLNDKEHEKFTLKHIYNKAGFVHQSTFNRVFREVEGLTPSEYIETIK